MKKNSIGKSGWIAIGVISLIVLVLCFAIQTKAFSSYLHSYPSYSYTAALATTTIATSTGPAPFVVTHIKTPQPVKALYMSSWVAGDAKLRAKLVDIIDTSELNSVVIDIKDYTGHISFEVDDPVLKAVGSAQNRIPDIKQFIGELHKKGIYVIGRISTFQDSYLMDIHPEYAVKTKEGRVWKDFKGVRWLDVSAKPVWDYIVAIGDEAYSKGFDELNFDYIRFPSDGNMKDIAYSYTEDTDKPQALDNFFAFIDKTFHAKGIPISADLFGMTTSNKDDLGIGQVLENALAHFDYVAPMVYPSHYPPNFNGWKNPAQKPYDTVFYAMTKGTERAVLASTTPSKLRPWLQDFSINGVTYTPEMIREQINATYKTGLSSWMLWNAANHYTASALLPPQDTISTSTISAPASYAH